MNFLKMYNLIIFVKCLIFKNFENSMLVKVSGFGIVFKLMMCI